MKIFTKFLFLVALCFQFFEMSAIVSPPPPNDDCTSAIPLTPNISCSYTTYTNAGATNSLTPGPTCANYLGGDVWFSVVVPPGGNLTIDTEAGEIQDSGMAAYRYCGFGDFLGCDDDSNPNGLMSRLVLSGLTPGETIYIRVWGWGGETGTFGICATAFNCIGPSLTGPTYDYSGCPNSYSVSYDVTSLGDANSYSLTNANGFTVTPSTITSAPTTITISGIPNGLASGNTTMNHEGDANCNYVISSPATYCPAPNDICTNAISITHWGSTVCGSPTTGNMVGASDNDETGDCTLGTEKAIWYSFTATNTSASVSVVGSYYFNAVIGALTTCGSPTVPAGGTCVNNSLLDGGTEFLNLTGLTVGNTYYIQVYDFSGRTNASNNFTICVKTPVPPPIPSNDLCIAATTITPIQSVQIYNATNLGATDDGPDCPPFNNQVWYKFDVEQTEDYTVSTCGSSFDSKINVYYGDCSSLTFVDCNANNTICSPTPYGQVIFRADPNPLKGGSVLQTRAPRTYYIAIGSNAVVEGSVQFAVYKEAVFPITLSSFNGKNNGETNILHWVTVSEKNVEYFAIERSLNGQTNWQVLEKITGQGNSSEARSYEATDKTPLPLSYYRLRIEDKNGEVNYSNIVSIENQKIKKSILIFPNPSNGMFNFQGTKLDNQKVILWNILGQKWESKIQNNHLDLTDRPKGIYFIQIGSDNQIFKLHKL